MNPITIAAFFDELEKIGAAHPANAAAIAAMKRAVAKMKIKTGTEKRATMVKYTKPKPRPRPEDIIKTSARREVARQANQFFGLPLRKPPRRNTKVYEQGPSAAESADRGQYPIVGDQSPNIAAGSIMTPSYGPGGV